MVAETNIQEIHLTSSIFLWGLVYDKKNNMTYFSVLNQDNWEGIRGDPETLVYLLLKKYRP